MKVFVTGGTGLVGEPVVRALVNRGDEVTALVRNTSSAERMRALGAVAVHGAVEDPRLWESLAPFDGMIHVAALIAARVPWQRFFQVNAEGTRLAASSARRVGARLVHLSSVAVYGRQAADDAPGTRTEHSPFGPVEDHDFYARSKRLAEEMVRAEVALGLEAVILRPCVVYGKGDRLFLPRLTRLARHGWLPRVGAGNAPLALVHAESVAAAALRALDVPRAAGRIYQVTNDGEISARQLTAAIAGGIGRRVRAVPVPERVALALAVGLQGALRVAGPGLYPGTITGAVRFWRGGNPYTSRRANDELDWHPAVRHAEVVAALARGFVPAA
ncbi:MAG TPA: NAD-dependent epimerase/dehydratase family protein [Gemmatimonadales bacterium]|nr:NAD-dependent epimerase/dehydratase family protein [Gemmatimonadales bacterium]